MVDILHKVGIEAPVDEVYAALTTTEGLSGWWTTDTKGNGGDIGGLLEFRFAAGGFDMRVRELDPAKRVLWEVVGGPEEWIGTQVDWSLDQEGDYTSVLFTHRGWREPVDFMHHCSTKWAVFLLSLKSLIETGKGAPDPDDIKIDSWN
ncbi:SRPBCC domain-containing protein [Nocardia beijingensis]|uniref:SRPBCC family protein n=1 Tax=Nocardia beijingensis TaxID=95162 RepID=UPI0033D8354A